MQGFLLTASNVAGIVLSYQCMDIKKWAPSQSVFQIFYQTMALFIATCRAKWMA